MPREIFEAIDYDAETGLFSSETVRISVGVQKKPYVCLYVYVDGAAYAAHRLAMHKSGFDVDAAKLAVHHVNHNPLDNRLHNLCPISNLKHRHHHAVRKRGTMDAWPASAAVFSTCTGMVGERLSPTFGAVPHGYC